MLLFWEIGSSRKRPFFSRKTKKKTSFLPWISGIKQYSLFAKLWTLCAWLLILCVLFLLLPFFRISYQSLYIARGDTLIDINRAYETLWYLREEHIAFTDFAKIENRLQKSQPWIRDVYIRRSFPNKLYISLRSENIIFQTENLLILESGKTLKKENKNYIDIPKIVLYDSHKQLLDQYSEVLEEEYIQKIIELQKSLQKNIPSFSYDPALYYIKQQELILQGTGLNILIFDLNGDINDQVKRLSVFHNEHTNISEANFVYIDVRIPRKIHYCSLWEEYACRSTLEKYYDFREFSFLKDI